MLYKNSPARRLRLTTLENKMKKLILVIVIISLLFFAVVVSAPVHKYECKSQYSDIVNEVSFIIPTLISDGKTILEYSSNCRKGYFFLQLIGNDHINLGVNEKVGCSFVREKFYNLDSTMITTKGIHFIGKFQNEPYQVDCNITK